MDKKIINIYGDDYDQVYTVACRIRNLTAIIPIVEKISDANPMGIMVSTTRNGFSGAECFNHCVDTNDVIDDTYVVGVWMRANRMFFES